MQKTHITFFLLILFSFSCNQKFSKLVNSGYTSDNFHTVIPFEEKMGLIIIKASIQGETYRFIFDTGSPTSIISSDIKKRLGLKNLATEKIYDVDNNFKIQEFSKINQLKLGNVSFSDIGTMIFDLNDISTIKCFGVDGLLGSNLFRHATWYIDYEKKEITIADNINSLEKPFEDFSEIKFFKGFGGVPSIYTYLNGQKVLNNTVDFGYGGEVSLDERNSKKIDIDLQQGYGVSSIGLYGKEEKKSMYKGVIESFSLGKDFNLKSQNVIFSGKYSNTIGTGILKYYHIILDWNNQKILLKRNNIDKKNNNDLGYSLSFIEGNVYVSNIYDNSQAQKKGLKLNDKIIIINDMKFDSIDDDKWCNYMSTRNELDIHYLLIERDSVRKELVF